MVCLALKFGTGYNFSFSEKDNGLWYFAKNRPKIDF